MDEGDLAAFTRSFFGAYHAPPLPAPLDLAEHLVFGAVAYVRDLGFEPARGFETTTGHLGPWGWSQRHPVWTRRQTPIRPGPHDHPDRVLATLERSVGPGNYNFLIVSP